MGAHGLPLMGTAIGTTAWTRSAAAAAARACGWASSCSILRRMGPLVAHSRKFRAGGPLPPPGRGCRSRWKACGGRSLSPRNPDDGTEIGLAGSGVWEIDALTAAWAVIAGTDHQRQRNMFDTALRLLERDTTILLGWPPSRRQPACPGPQQRISAGRARERHVLPRRAWLVGAAGELARAAVAAATSEGGPLSRRGLAAVAQITPLSRSRPKISKPTAASPTSRRPTSTAFDPGRMIWHGYTAPPAGSSARLWKVYWVRRLVDGKVLPTTDPVLAGR